MVKRQLRSRRALRPGCAAATGGQTPRFSQRLISPFPKPLVAGGRMQCASRRTHPHHQTATWVRPPLLNAVPSARPGAGLTGEGCASPHLGVLTLDALCRLGLFASHSTLPGLATIKGLLPQAASHRFEMAYSTGWGEHC